VDLVRITDLPAVGRVLATVTAARQVRESLRFAARELGRSRATRGYTLRGSEVAINIRHNSPDVAVLIEIFADGFYEPPAPVARLLAKPAPRAVDLGANIGLFGAFLAARLPSARIVGFEPDRANAAVHRQTIADNGRNETWSLIEACAATADGTVSFQQGAFAGSRVESSATSTVPALDVFGQLDGVDLLKIDIEGSEWPILGDERMRGAPVPALVLEYHPHLCPGDDARATALELLGACGYEVKPIFHDPQGHGMLWAWRASAPDGPAPKEEVEQ
jgi:FkbM family methyltransferase